MNGAKEVSHRYLRKIKCTLFDSGLGARLPQEYRKFYDEWKNTPPEPVHYERKEGTKWKMDERLNVLRWHEEYPIPGKVPKEFHNVFSGGEMIIQGFLPPKATSKKFGPKFPRPKFWVPTVYRSVIYSEILNKHMSVLLTNRFIDKIHEFQGLDKYLLQTKACDLLTLITLHLKRKLLLSLRDKDLPYDEEKNSMIYKKYEKFLLPPEEVEWYGLSYGQACQKLKELEKKQKEDSIVPLKHIFRAQLIEELKEGLPETSEKKPESSTWLSKLSTFPTLSKTKSFLK